MALPLDRQYEHLLRRAGFGARSDELDTFRQLSIRGAVDLLTTFEDVPDNVDQRIGQPGYASMTIRGMFSPRTVITDARQRWLFRMVHTNRPLQEKMTLFWHNHFATAYSKVAGAVGTDEGTRLMAASPQTDRAEYRGQIALFRDFALGNFRDLLIEVAKDPAMSVWLDGRLNTRDRPQENFGRELMELFTTGVGHYTEDDIYAAARAFTGWSLRRVNAGTAQAKYEFVYNAGNHDTNAKRFTFPIFPDGGTTIPARGAAAGLQDGIDLINALARHPATGRRLARRLWGFFVSEVNAAPDDFVERIAGVYYSQGFDMKAVVQAVLTSPEFFDPANYHSRYAWPVEFVVRAIKEVGWDGYSVNNAMTPLSNMGQQLFEPPDVNGWELGPGWFSTSAMLARMNYASALTLNQRVNLRNDARPFGRTAQSALQFILDRLTPRELDPAVYRELLTYLESGRPWTGSDADLLVKIPGAAHLVMASAQYQIV